MQKAAKQVDKQIAKIAADSEDAIERFGRLPQTAASAMVDAIDSRPEDMHSTQSIAYKQNGKAPQKLGSNGQRDSIQLTKPPKIEGLDEVERPSSFRSGMARVLQPYNDLMSKVLPRLRYAGNTFIIRPLSGATRCAARFPCFCVVIEILILAAIIVFGLLELPMDIDTDFSSFLSTDVEASLKRDAFRFAYDARPKVMKSRRLADTYSVKNLYLAYELDSESGSASLLDTRVLKQIASFEHSLRSSSKWIDLCAQSEEEDHGACDPGMSLAGYVFPSMVYSNANDGSGVMPSKPEELSFTGLGAERLPFSFVNALLNRRQLLDVFLPEGFNISAFVLEDIPVAHRLRSAFRFKIPLVAPPNSGMTQQQVADKLKKDWDALAEDIVFSTIDELEDQDFKVYFTGTDLDRLQIITALKRDMLFTIGSVGFVLMYLLIHTRSILLTSVGVVTMMTSVPLSYIIFALLADTRTVNFTYFLAVFILAGFGCDVIFVYTDTWLESAQHFEDEGDRLVWTYQSAGRASLATTLVAALSFFANLVSVIRALRQLGFFMGICIILAWVLISLIFVPLMVFDQRVGWFRFCAKDVGRRRREKMRALTEHLRGWRFLYILAPVVLLGASVAPTILNVGMDYDIPSIFPEEHNHNYGYKVFDRFHKIDDTILDDPFMANFPPAQVCNTSAFGNANCDVYWCEIMPSTQALPSSTQCFCYQTALLTDSACSPTADALVSQRLVLSPAHAEKLATSANSWITGLVQQLLPRNGFVQSTTVLTGGFTAGTSSLMQYDWEAGVLSTKTVLQIQSQLPRPSSNLSCGFEDLCYCGETYSCPMDTQVLSTPDVPPADNGRRLNFDMSVTRQLQAAEPLAVDRMIVSTVFGLEVTEGVEFLVQRKPSDQWSYLTSFELRQPWSQRNIRDYCEMLEQTPQLMVILQRCWMSYFKQYVVNELGEKFPLQPFRFDEVVTEFVEKKSFFTGGGVTGGDRDIWYVDGVVRAIVVPAQLNFDRKKEPNSAVMDMKKKWDDHIKQYNDAAQPYAKGAWHFSDTFAEAEASEELIFTASLTVGILLVLAFIGMIVFTCSIVLSIYVVVATTSIMVGLAFFVVVAMQWEIGLLEVIATLYFIGYAVTYSLHIVHKYAYFDKAPPDFVQELPQPSSIGHGARTAMASHRQESVRWQRTCFAMMSIANAALGSAVTTAGSSFFLVLCSLTVFTKLGIMCLTVTLLSILVALFPLPAALLTFGPLNPGYGCCCPKRVASSPDPDCSPDSDPAFAPPALRLGPADWEEPVINIGDRFSL